MRNLKVGKKLTVVFAIIMVLFIAMAAVGGVGMLSVASGMEEFYNTHFQVVDAQYSMRVNMQAAIKNVLWACTSETDAETNYFLDQMNTHINNINAELPTLKTLFTGDQSLITEFESELAGTAAVRERLMELIKTNHVEESLEMFNKDYAPPFTTAQDNLVEIGELATANAKEIYGEVEATKTAALISLAAAVAAAVALIIFFGVYITKSITKPVAALENAAKEMANGNLDVDIYYQSRDELGDLSDSMRKTTKMMSDIIADISYLTNEMAHGNFDITTKVEEKYVGSFSPILMSLRDMNQSLSRTLSEINESSDQVASGSGQVSSAAQALSQGATEQASAVQQLAATINEISNQVQSTADNAMEANNKMSDVAKEVVESNGKMHDMIQAMEEISSSSSEIGKIIKTIEDIAFQTNILALNAAVEAARAGAAGKGFAVVADEVRNLASKSAEASKNTAALIEASIHAVENGTRIAGDTAQSLNVVVDGTKEVNAAVERITSATNAQAESITQITQGIEQISAVVQTNSATAEQSAASSEELSGQSEMLKRLVGRFILKQTNALAAPKAVGSIPTSHVNQLTAGEY